MLHAKLWKFVFWAFRLSSCIDDEIEPCENFYRYSCQRYHSQTADKQMSFLSQLKDESLRRMHSKYFTYVWTIKENQKDFRSSVIWRGFKVTSKVCKTFKKFVLSMYECSSSVSFDTLPVFITVEQKKVLPMKLFKTKIIFD